MSIDTPQDTLAALCRTLVNGSQHIVGCDLVRVVDAAVLRDIQSVLVEWCRPAPCATCKGGGVVTVMARQGFAVRTARTPRPDCC